MLTQLDANSAGWPLESRRCDTHEVGHRVRPSAAGRRLFLYRLSRRRAGKHLSAYVTVSSVMWLVVGAGNAAPCAAISARESGTPLSTVLERAPQVPARRQLRLPRLARCRVAYLRARRHPQAALPDLTGADAAKTNFGSYTKTDFYLDLARVTEYRGDPGSPSLLTERQLRLRSAWMRDHGVRFAPMYGRQAYDVDGQTHVLGAGLSSRSLAAVIGLAQCLAARRRSRRASNPRRSPGPVSLHYEADVLRGVKAAAPRRAPRWYWATPSSSPCRMDSR